MAKIFVEDQAHEVDAKKNLLEVCLGLGYDIPYFCWHPALGSVGACRQCAVKQFRNEDDKQGRLVMSCMTPADDGTRISIRDEEAKEFRASIVEWLMTNHPHDCPVCDEGGECHLQDMTVMTGHNYRDYRFPKRTFENQYLGPFLNHEMNRCIECYRCVRYYREYAGGRDLNVFASRNRVYFGRHEDGVLENEFSGNLVEICPTGVFTDKTLKKHYTRKWDLQMAPSLCVHCGVGCNVTPGERYGSVRRIVNRYNHHVNGYFLCDRGRFGYEFVNSPQRIREPRLRSAGGGPLAPANKQAAIEAAVKALSGGGKAIGIGSPRASLESNFALRELVGPANFFAGVSDVERSLTARAIEILRRGPAPTPTLVDLEAADAVVILGEDVTQTAPRLALGLRQAALNLPREKARELGIPQWHDAALREVIQEDRGPFYIASTAGTRLDDLATETVHASPEEIASFGFALAHAIDAAAPQPAGLSTEIQERARKVAEMLKQARRPIVVTGVSSGSAAILDAAANVATALCGPGRVGHLAIALPECNSMGLALLAGLALDAAGQEVRRGAAETIIVLENDLFRRMARAEAEALIRGARTVIALDHIANETTEKAAIVFPAASFAEGDGAFVSHEGRAQGFVQLVGATGSVQESWRWLREIACAAGRDVLQDWNTISGARAAIAKQPSFAGIEALTPPGDFRIAGQKIPRQPHRYSGRTAMLAHINVSEPKPPEDPDSPMSFSMEGYPGKPPSALIPFFWAPSWNSVQATAKFQQEVGGELRGGDPGLRLLEPAPDTKPSPEAKPAYNGGAPGVAARPEGQWLAVPLYHIFGSDELSILSPAVAERAPQPYLALHPEDAAALDLAEGAQAELRINGSVHRFPVKAKADLARGLAGVPAGLPQTKSLQLPAWSEIAKVS
jgi:NADH-quinone oxidoreductase subunit G